MLSLPANLALVADTAKSAAQLAAAPTTKPSRWNETKASMSLPKAPRAPSRVYDFVVDKPCACSMPPKAPQRSVDVPAYPRKKVLVSHAA